MRSDCVVVTSPFLHYDLGLEERAKDLAIQESERIFPSNESIWPFSRGLSGSINSGSIVFAIKMSRD